LLRGVQALGLAERDGVVSIDRGEGIHEWFAHDARGLEQGIDLETPPTGKGELRIDVAADGLTAVLAGDGETVELRDASGVRVLRYTGLVATDAANRRLPASMAAVDGVIELRVRDEGARYPLRVDPIVLAKQESELLASDAAAQDNLGWSVAIGGTTALVGAPFKNVGVKKLQGVAYVFTKTGSAWAQQQKLAAADGAAGDGFGNGVALSDVTAVVGAPNKSIGSNVGQGAVYVFTSSGGAWTEAQRLVASDGAAYDDFGCSVALSGNTMIVGAYSAAVGAKSGQGVAYVFTLAGSIWTQQQKLVAADGAANDDFGYSVAISGATALVGARGRGGQRGAAYVFAQSGTSWTQQGSALVPPGGAGGGRFGEVVAIDGSSGFRVGSYWQA
jgi:hypothetical protein